MALLVTGLLLWAVLALAQGPDRLGGLPFNPVIDGQDVSAGLGTHRLDPGPRLLLAGVAVLAGLWLLVALPLALLAGAALLLGLLLGLVLMVVLRVVLGVLLGSVGLPLLAVALVLGLLALPLLLLWGLLRWLLG